MDSTAWVFFGKNDDLRLPFNGQMAEIYEVPLPPIFRPVLFF